MVSIHHAAEKERGDVAIDDQVEQEIQHVVGVKRWLVVATVTLVASVLLLDMSIIVMAIPQITNEVHSLADVGWYGSAYLLSNSALQPLAGTLYTLLPLKPTFLSFLFLSELGSLLCGTSTSSRMLIIGRAVAGLGGAGLMNGAICILCAAAPKERQPLLIGVMMGLSQIAIVWGPLLGGMFTQGVGWRWCFYVNIPLGAMAAVLLLCIGIPDRLTLEPLSDSDKKLRSSVRAILSQLDMIGFVLFAAFAIMLSLALEWGGSEDRWRSDMNIGLFCGGGIALFAFVAWERQIGDAKAMIPSVVAGKREVWCSCFFLTFFSGALLIFSFYIPIYFQAVKNVSPTLSGVYMLPGILGQILMAVVSGVMIGNTDYYAPWALAKGIIASVSAGLVSTFSPSTSTVRWVLYQFIGGFGRGCGIQTPIIPIQNSLPPQQSALGVSLAIFRQTFGGSLFLALAKSIFTNGLLAGLHDYTQTVDSETVLADGATGFRQVVAVADILGVLKAYSQGVDRTFYLAAGGSVATFVFAWGMGWQKICKKDESLVES